MNQIRWDLLQSGTNAGGFMQAFEQGQEMGRRAREARQEQELRDAYAAFAADPMDRNALQQVMARDPRMGVQLADYQERQQFRSALADYMSTPGASALMGAGTASSGNALAQVANPSPESVQRDGGFAPLAPATPPQGQGLGNADLSILGRPQSAQDASFLRMVRSDPVKAMEIQSTLRDNFVERLRAEHDVYGIAVQELGRVQDDAGWQRALGRIRPIADQFGMDLSNVPQAYPGEEAVAQLLETALPVKERLALLLQEANIEADNARADRNTDSLIETREGRLGEYQRANRAREANQRRGQDMSDARQRARLSRGSSRSGRGAGDLPVVSSPADASRLAPGTQFRTPDGRTMRVPAN